MSSGIDQKPGGSSLVEGIASAAHPQVMDPGKQTHAAPDMKVYHSTLEYDSRPLRNFDRQVFSVAFARVAK